jgi:hypothetical protein
VALVFLTTVGFIWVHSKSVNETERRSSTSQRSRTSGLSILNTPISFGLIIFCQFIRQESSPMRFGPLLRILGTALYGFIGFEIGVVLARTPELAINSWMLVIPFTLFGAAFGFLLAPWLVSAPATAAHKALRQVPITDLVAGTIGVTAGLLIAALLSVPISRLPEPFGNVVPLLLVFMFGYLGAALLVLRQRDFFSMLRGGSEEKARSTPAPSTS